MTLDVPEILAQSFQLRPIQARAPRVCFSGNGDGAAVPALQRFVAQLHDELVFKKAEKVEVDMGELYFMNSSCLKAFVSWIHKVDTGGRPYSIHLLTNPRQQWQLRSLATLQRLAPQVVCIEEPTS